LVLNCWPAEKIGQGDVSMNRKKRSLLWLLMLVLLTLTILPLSASASPNSPLTATWLFPDQNDPYGNGTIYKPIPVSVSGNVEGIVTYDGQPSRYYYRIQDSEGLTVYFSEWQTIAPSESGQGILLMQIPSSLPVGKKLFLNLLVIKDFPTRTEVVNLPFQYILTNP
jgi:hypothetical protein